MSHVINEGCIKCGACISECPVTAICFSCNSAVIDPDICIDCGACEGVCPVGVIAAE